MVTRRNTLQFMASVLGFAALSIRADDKISDVCQTYTDVAAADRWMLAWISPAAEAQLETKAPNGALHMGRFADPMYYLVSTIGWDPNPGQAAQYQSIRVPVGFVTDLASVPRIFWTRLRPDGLYSYAAIIHDYLYWEQYLSRKESDEVLQLCMEDFEVPAVDAAAIYAGVRLGGGGAWESNGIRKAAGEKRVLKKFPTDPRTRWIDWKSQVDVFQ